MGTRVRPIKTEIGEDAYNKRELAVMGGHDIFNMDME